MWPNEETIDVGSAELNISRQFENSEGDWQAYLSRCSEISSSGFSPVDRLEAKRLCALAYLGKRAQARGGVYSKRGPRIFTPHFVLALADANRIQRFERYPWLERLLALLAEIESVQQQISSQAKVLPFARPAK